MNLTGTPKTIIDQIAAQYPNIHDILKQARAIVPPSTRAIAEYQAAALYTLARGYNKPGARVLEIGTAQGYSAAVLALALPDAEILTLNPHHEEAAGARRALAQFGSRVHVVEAKSWDVLAMFDAEPFDVIFVDGDHKNVRRDLPWWKHLREGGLMLFHDFSPNGTYRACPPVYRALLEFKKELGRAFDVLIVDEGGVGMAGFVKQPGEDLDTEVRDQLATALAYSSASYSYLTGLYQLAASKPSVDGCIVECGVQNGGSAAALALGYKYSHGGREPKLWLFDNFTGVPQPAPEDGGKALMRWSDNPDGWSRGDKASVREVLKKLGIKGAKIIEGQFSASFDKDAYKTGQIAILHIDATLYESTKLAIERFYDLLAPGGLVIVSAYHHWEGIRNAVEGTIITGGNLLKTMEKGVWWRV